MFKIPDSLMRHGPQAAKAGVLGGGAIIAGGWFFGNCLFNIDAGHRAILFSRWSGTGNELYHEGTHFVIPWLQRCIIYDVRTRPRNMVSLTGSKDLQMINITLRTLCRPDESKLDTIYRQLGKDYDEKVLPSIINEVLKSVVAKFTASELLTQREVVSRMVREELMERAKNFNLVLDDVSITHIAFSPEYANAVEQKQVAQQQAEKGKYLVMKAQEQKKRIVIKAEGEMQAAKLIGRAIKDNPGFVELRRIDAGVEIANNLSKSKNKLVLNSGVLLMNATVGDPSYTRGTGYADSDPQQHLTPTINSASV